MSQGHLHICHSFQLFVHMVNCYIGFVWKVGEGVSSKIKVVQPRIYEHMAEIKFEDLCIDDYPSLSNGIIRDCIIEEQDLDKLEFSQVVFKNVIFINVAFTNSLFTDVVFENCDLSNANFLGANMHRVECKGSKMLGINLADSNFQHVLFDECMLNLSAFGYGRLKHVLFSDCRMHNADFYECTFKKMDFDTCELNEASFHHTPLKGIDLSNSTFQQLTVSVEDLRGCTISSEQAVGFATMLGLIIKE